MLEKIKDKLKYLYYTAAFWALQAQYAWAKDESANDAGAATSINPITPDEMIDKVQNLFITVGVPFGTAILVGCAIYIAIRIMAAGGDSRKRAEAIEGLQAVIIGGLIIGGIPFFVGLILGLGNWLAGK